METAPQYSRYSVSIGHYVVVVLRLYDTQVERAQNGNSQARRNITETFIKQLRTLGFFVNDSAASSNITYDQLTISRQ